MMPSPKTAAAAKGLVLQGLVHHQRGELVQAQNCYDQALDVEPDHFDALHLCGVAAYQLGEPARARELIAEAISINPREFAPHANLGNALRSLGEYAAALQSFDRALALRSDDAVVHSNRGNALRALGRLDEAVQCFDRVIALDTKNASAHINRGHTLQQLGKHVDAIASYDKAITLAPTLGLALAHRQRGVSLAHLGDHDAALVSHGAAIALAPADPDSYTARGNAYRALQKFAPALADYATALALDARCKEALFNRGAVLDDLKDFQGAAASFGAVLALQPDYPYAAALRLHAQRQICDWEYAAERAAEIGSLLAAGGKAVMPFQSLALMDSPAAQLRAAEHWNSERSLQTPLWDGELYRHARLRVAYLSADFHDHPVANLMAGVLEAHDKSRFETVGISLQRHAGAVHLRLQQAFEHFHDVSGCGDREAALLLREREIDIAIDLTGYTGGGRLGILAFRPAPVQIGFLGYAGTTGARSMDYLIADEVTIPTGHEQFFSEQVVRMPHSFLPNDDRQAIAQEIPTRRSLGLPETGFVFCAFNNTFKLNPELFEVWMQLLKKTPGSVLWMRGEPGVVTENLAREAKSRGIAADRLIFASRVASMPEHLARYRAADLFLDTLPYGAHSTARDALWSGVPVLTCLGSTFAGRVAGSLLTALDLPELVTSSLGDYAERALDLAHSPALLGAVRDKLAQNRLTKPVFDTDLYRRHLEAAFIAMCGRQRRQEPPQSFSVTAIR